MSLVPMFLPSTNVFIFKQEESGYRQSVCFAVSSGCWQYRNSASGAWLMRMKGVMLETSVPRMCLGDLEREDLRTYQHYLLRFGRILRVQAALMVPCILLVHVTSTIFGLVSIKIHNSYQKMQNKMSYSHSKSHGSNL